jgi:hypothetical protein
MSAIRTMRPDDCANAIESGISVLHPELSTRCRETRTDAASSGSALRNISPRARDAGVAATSTVSRWFPTWIVAVGSSSARSPRAPQAIIASARSAARRPTQVGRRAQAPQARAARRSRAKVGSPSASE